MVGQLCTPKDGGANEDVFARQVPVERLHPEHLPSFLMHSNPTFHYLD
jgi:hypothetical protein